MGKEHISKKERGQRGPTQQQTVVKTKSNAGGGGKEAQKKV